MFHQTVNINGDRKHEKEPNGNLSIEKYSNPNEKFTPGLPWQI
jgi:hypothetical protein